MNGKEKIKSFADLAATTGGHKKQDKEEKEGWSFVASKEKDAGSFKEKDNGPLKEIFKRGVKEKFDRISNGSFKSKLEGVDSFVIVPIPLDAPEKQAINITINYHTKGGAEKREQWSVGRDGMISGRPLKETGVSWNVLAREILTFLAETPLEFWYKTGLEIIPDQDAGESHPHRAGSEYEPVPIDPERLRFLAAQENVLFGFVHKGSGFRGYYGTVFPTFILLEKPQKDNAAFIIDLEKPIAIPQERFNLPPDKRMSDNEKEQVLEKYWKPISERARTKKALIALGAKRFVHTPETWQEKMQGAINARSK